MKSRLIAEQGPERTFVLILDEGEEAFTFITRFATDNSLTGASLTALGAFSQATVGWFDLVTKTYRPIPVQEQCEALSLIGDIATGDDGMPSLHMHAVLGLKDGSTRGGHFLQGHVRPTLEVVIVETAAHLHRRKHPEHGVALLDP
jgi:predicted DNA-binding protein with PD1-like motif